MRAFLISVGGDTSEVEVGGRVWVERGESGPWSGTKEE